MQALTRIDRHSNYQPTVLVVEDNEDNLIYISTALALLNCHSIITKDAIKSLSLAQENQPDMIILDIKMPKLSGIDLINLLKLDWLTRNIPVIAVTALAREQEKKLILDAGFNDYLVKPFLIEDLEQIICSHILNYAFPE